MRVKSSTQQNIVQIVILSICPLLAVINNLNQGLFYILATCICFAVSAVICKIFNKLFSKNMKVFITAILSTFILTIVNYMLGKHTILGIETPTASYYAVLSTMCLCLDAYFLDKKSEKKLYIFKIIYDCVYFAVILMIFSVFTEFLGFGTVFKVTIIPGFTGNPFFQTMVSKFLMLGIIHLILETTYQARQEKAYEKKIILEKYVRRIRDEKFFQYDSLRRKQLLASKIIINNVNDETVMEIEEKLDQNEMVETEAEKKLKIKEAEEAKEAKEAAKISKKDKKAIKTNSKKKFKDSKEEKAVEKKPKKEKKVKPEKLKGSVRNAKVERVFINNENNEDNSEK